MDVLKSVIKELGILELLTSIVLESSLSVHALVYSQGRVDILGKAVKF